MHCHLSKICNKSKKIKDIYILSPQFQVTYFILNIFSFKLHCILGQKILWTSWASNHLLMHLLESIFSLNHVIVRPIKIMNRADKNWAHFYKLFKAKRAQKLLGDWAPSHSKTWLLTSLIMVVEHFLSPHYLTSSYGPVLLTQIFWENSIWLFRWRPFNFRSSNL